MSYEPEYEYTFRGRADTIRDARRTILDKRYGEDSDLYEHVILLSTTVEALLVAMAKMMEQMQ